MYKVYMLKKTGSGSEVMKETRTQTPSAEAATAAFWALRNDPAYSGKPYLLLMTRDKEKLNRHWFNRAPGDDQYVAPDASLKLA